MQGSVLSSCKMLYSHPSCRLSLRVHLGLVLYLCQSVTPPTPIQTPISSVASPTSLSCTGRCSPSLSMTTSPLFLRRHQLQIQIQIRRSSPLHPLRRARLPSPWLKLFSPMVTSGCPRLSLSTMSRLVSRRQWDPRLQRCRSLPTVSKTMQPLRSTHIPATRRSNRLSKHCIFLMQPSSSTARKQQYELIHNTLSRSTHTPRHHIEHVANTHTDGVDISCLHHFCASETHIILSTPCRVISLLSIKHPAWHGVLSFTTRGKEGGSEGRFVLLHSGNGA
jgi:hypothetical protein